MRNTFALVLVLTFSMVLATGNGVWAVPVTTGLVSHFDAQSASSVLNASNLPAADGQYVQTWKDLVGSSDASPYTASDSARPVYDETGGPLGQPAIAFDGSDNLLSGSMAAKTVVLFHRWDVNAGSHYLMDFRPGFGTGYVYTGSVGSNWSTFYIDDATTTSSGVASIRTGNWQMTTFVGSAAGSAAMYMMSRYSNGEFAQGAIGEILVYNDVLTESQRLETYAYLDARWNHLPPVPTPEPSSFLLLGLGALGLVGNARRKIRRCQE
jgi:hypothetical protein